MFTNSLKSRDACHSDLKLDKALSIPGWMHPTELLWLAEKAKSHFNIAELGCYLGRSTRALADNTKGTVLAVDDFYGPRDAEIDSRDIVYKTFLKNMEGVEDKIRVAKGDFSVIKPEECNAPFDMIFIDGCHEYLAIRRDIDKWLPYLSPGGLICGHDFSLEYPDVMKAVLETFTYKAKVFPETCIWFVG